MSGLEQTIPDGYQLTEVGVIPEDWSVKQVSKAFEICNTLRFPLSAKVRESMVGEYPYYGPTKIQDYINEYRIDGEYALIGEDGDHFLKFETVPQTQLAKGRFNVNNHAHVIKGKTASTEWFYLYFKHREITSHLSRQGAGRYKLNKATLEQIPCAVPSLKEQTAIANALSDVDALLSELDKLISKKQAIKTATMQQLLTGKTRFPQFATYADGDKQGQIKGTKSSELGEIPEDWEVVMIESLCDLATGSTPSTNNVDNYGTEYLFTSPADLKGQKYIENTVKKLSHAGWSISRKYPPNSILFTCIGSTIGKCGMSRKWLTSNQQINAVFPSEKVIADYLYYQLSHAAPRIKEQAGEQAVPIINKTEFGKSLIFKPNNKKEQIAIAAILSDMDEEIQALQQRLSKTRQIKQGMMQELLTGKTRLPFEKSGDMKLQGEPHAD